MEDLNIEDYELELESKWVDICSHESNIITLSAFSDNIKITRNDVIMFMKHFKIKEAT